MIDIEDEVRRSLRELAEQGQPVQLGRAALAGARRRRRRRNVATGVAAAVALVAVVLPAQLYRPDSGGGESVVAEPPAPLAAGRHVVTSYYPGLDKPPMLLNPRTGDYHPTDAVFDSAVVDPPPMMSPDLQWVAVTRGPSLHVAAADPGRDSYQRIPLPSSLSRYVSWSPDSTRIAVRALAGESWQQLRQLVVVEPGTGRAYEVHPRFARGQVGVPPSTESIGWLDSHHLAIPVSETTRLAMHPGLAGEGSRITTGIAIVDLTGALVRVVPIDQDDVLTTDERPAGLAWQPYGPVRNGQMLLTRQPEPGTLELVVVDLTDRSADPEPYRPVSVSVPSVALPDELQLDDGGWPEYQLGRRLAGLEHHGTTPDGMFFSGLYPMAWLRDGYVLAQSGEYRWEDGFRVPSRHYVIDLGSGELQQVELPVPERWGVVTFAEAELLPPEAAQRAQSL